MHLYPEASNVFLPALLVGVVLVLDLVLLVLKGQANSFCNIYGIHNDWFYKTNQ